MGVRKPLVETQTSSPATGSSSSTAHTAVERCSPVPCMGSERQVPGSITRISEIETRARKGAFRTVNLVEIAGEVVELYDAAAEEVTTDLDLAGDPVVLVTGDPSAACEVEDAIAVIKPYVETDLERALSAVSDCR